MWGPSFLNEVVGYLYDDDPQLHREHDTELRIDGHELVEPQFHRQNFFISIYINVVSCLYVVVSCLYNLLTNCTIWDMVFWIPFSLVNSLSSSSWFSFSHDSSLLSSKFRLLVVSVSLRWQKSSWSWLCTVPSLTLYVLQDGTVRSRHRNGLLVWQSPLCTVVFSVTMEIPSRECLGEISVHPGVEDEIVSSVTWESTSLCLETVGISP